MSRGVTLFATVLAAALSLSAQKTPRPATQQEELTMMGKVLGVIEDAGGGYTREALQRCSSVTRDIDKRQYSPHTRWGAHHWCGKAHLDAKDLKGAITLLQSAHKDAESLSEKERQETADLLHQAEEKQGVK